MNSRSQRLAADFGPGLVALVAAAGTIVWMWPRAYNQDLLALGVTYSLLALGMYVPFVMARSLSMAYSAYLAVGGYAVALVSTHTEWNLLWGFLFGMVASAIIALILGALTARLSGFYLAAVTLLFGMAFATWLIDSPDISGGSGGLGGLRGLTVFTPVDGRQLLVGGVIVVWLIGVGFNRLRRSPFGLAIRSAGEHDVATSAAGVPTKGLTLVSLAVGAAVASLGGSIFAVYNGAIGPETFSLAIVFLAIFMPLLGGRDTAWGTVVGAALVVELTFNVPWFQDYGNLIFTAAVLLVVMIAPKGILGYLGDGARAVVKRGTPP